MQIVRFLTLGRLLRRHGIFYRKNVYIYRTERGKQHVEGAMRSFGLIGRTFSGNVSFVSCFSERLLISQLVKFSFYNDDATMFSRPILFVYKIQVYFRPIFSLTILKRNS